MIALLAQPILGETYEFNSRQSDIGFKIGHFGGTVSGEFKKFRGELEFDKKKPENSSVKLSIDINSIDTGSEKRDSHLQEEDYFHASKFPQMTFESVAFKKRGDNQYVVTGPLTIRGVEKNITLYVTLESQQAQWAIGGDALTFESEYELNRLDFGVSGGQPAVGKTVEVMLRVKAYGGE